jgi:hypothetical protein
MNNLKNKCVNLRTFNIRSGIDQTAVLLSSTATAGFFNIEMGDSFTGTTLNNRTYRWVRFVDTGSFSYTAYVPGTSLGTSEIYVFSSKRKLIIFAPETSGRKDYSSVLEFPETKHIIKNNNLPAICSNVSYAHSASPNLTTDRGTSGAINLDIHRVGSSAGNIITNIYHAHQFSNWYSSVLTTRAQRQIQSWGVNNIDFFSNPPLNVTLTGSDSYPLIPISDVRVDYGEGMHDYSSLTDMYITYRESSYTNDGDTIKINGTDYVIMQVGDSITNYRSFAIKKG